MEEKNGKLQKENLEIKNALFDLFELSITKNNEQTYNTNFVLEPLRLIEKISDNIKLLQSKTNSTDKSETLGKKSRSDSNNKTRKERRPKSSNLSKLVSDKISKNNPHKQITEKKHPNIPKYQEKSKFPEKSLNNELEKIKKSSNEKWDNYKQVNASKN